MTTPISGIPFPNRFNAKLKVTDDASPEGDGDIQWDAATETLQISDGAGSWNDYTLGGSALPVSQLLSVQTSITGTTPTVTVVWNATADYDDIGVAPGSNDTDIEIPEDGIYTVGCWLILALDDGYLSATANVRRNGTGFTLGRMPVAYIAGIGVYYFTLAAQQSFAAGDIVDVTVTATGTNGGAGNAVATQSRLWFAKLRG